MRRGIRHGAALLISVLPLAGCLDGLDVADQLRPKPAEGSPEPASGGGGPAQPLRALCGLQRLAEVAELACALERGLCEQWAACENNFTSLEACVAERELACRERAQVALSAGACFLPQLQAANADNGCYAGWQQAQGACVLPTLEELTRASLPCLDEWTPGQLAEGETCTYGAAGCATPDAPELRSYCAYETSTELDGGACRWVPDLARGAECDPAALEYCNRTDGCLSSGICDQRRELGAGCAADNDCASLLCAEGVCTDPEGFSCAERSCPILWLCEDGRCSRSERLF